MTKKNNQTNLKYPADWLMRKQAGKKISVITSYDACFSQIIASSDIDAILVGDSLGMVVQGHDSTLRVTLQEMIYHSRMVRRGAPSSYIIADMPFASYQSDIKTGTKNALKLMKKGFVDAIKLEGANKKTCAIIKNLTEAGVPVVGHLGLTPQSYLSTSGFRVQGKTKENQEQILQQSKDLEEAGCFSVVLELMKSSLAKKITSSTKMVTIGIGAGIDVDAQVLVLHDVLGLFTEFEPRHVKKYFNMAELTQEALNKFHSDINALNFPEDKNSFL